MLISTRHHLHARQVIAALEAGKDVFVEKPLCLTEDELAEIEQIHSRQAAGRGRPPVLMVGYNRRFAPMCRRIREHFADVDEPLVAHYRVNAGYLPLDHWTQDPETGGGRIVGEVCHFVDTLAFLAGALPVRVYARALANGGRYRDDNLSATIEMADGSIGLVTYVANGPSALAKERLEVFGGGSGAVLDNYRTLELMRGSRRRVERARLRQDKGHRAELEAFVAAVRDRAESPIPLADSVAVARATLAIVRSLREGAPVDLTEG